MAKHQKTNFENASIWGCPKKYLSGKKIKEPSVTISKKYFYINVSATKMFFSHIQYCEIYLDWEGQRIGFKPIDDKSENSYKLSHGPRGSRAITATNVINRIHNLIGRRKKYGVYSENGMMVVELDPDRQLSKWEKFVEKRDIKGPKVSVYKKALYFNNESMEMYIKNSKYGIINITQRKTIKLRLSKNKINGARKIGKTKYGGVLSTGKVYQALNLEKRQKYTLKKRGEYILLLFEK